MHPAEEESFVFISYTSVDEAWATWVASVLETTGLTARIQAWDVLPGQNFIEWMNEQLESARWTVALYSEAYFGSAWCTAEWTAALARKTLLPVRLEPIVPPVILRSLTWVDLFDMDEERARERLLYAVGAQVIPRLAAFPGRAPTTPHDFPGPARSLPSTSDPATVMSGALDHLASPSIPIRLAAIRHLARISDRHAADQPLIDEIGAVLTSYLRSNQERSGPGEETMRAAARLLARLLPLSLPPDLGGVRLVQAHLPGVNLHKAFLVDAYLSGCDLAGADLSEAILYRADLSDANLAGANLAGATLTRAKLAGASLAGASAAGGNFVDADLAKADLREADFTNTDLSGAKLSGSVNVQTGNESTIEIRCALLDRTILTGSELDKALLNSVNLARAVGLTQEQLERARGDNETIVPPGLSRPDAWIA